MKSLLNTIAAIIFLLLLGCSQQTPTATITIKAVDETGKPIETVNISVGYQRSSPSGTKVHVEKGFTNSSGEFSSKAKTNGHVTFKAEKEGYYRSHGAHDFYKVGGSLIKSWGPSNPTINLTLRKIMNPVPMYARNTSGTMLEVPAIGEDIGFDLFLGDWVVPYGKGETPDFIFNMGRNYTNRNENNGVLKIKFANKYDGIRGFNDTYHRGSDFKTAYIAPIDGYKGNYQKYVSRSNGVFETNVDKKLNYVFRVRSEEKDGQLYRGMYGKIHGDIVFDVMSSKTAQVSFRYFLNPDYSRNLEFDPKRNLSKGLNSLEEIWLN